MNRSTWRNLGVVAAGVAVMATVATLSHEQTQAQATTLSRRVPVFEVDTSWPPKLPNNWVLGHVASVAVDRHDHVWMLHRPNTVPEAQRKQAAPPVLEFDDKGKFVRAWGGPGKGYDWPDSEHGIAVDYRDRVWIGGSAPVAPSLRDLDDDMLVKFDNRGRFLLQIGGRSTSKGNADTRNVHQSADVFVYQKTNEAFIADGYGNRRVIVVDADTGAFKRMWGAFGNQPVDVPAAPRGGGAGAPAAGAGGGRAAAPPAAGAPAAGAPAGGRGAAPAGGGRGAAPALDTEGRGSEQFGGPVHAVKVSNDGNVYVADRPNRRVQVFTPEGKYVTQVFINRAGPSAQSAAGLAFSPDAQQQFLYVADYGNSRIVVVDRKSLEVLYQFGERSAKPGDFQGLHHLAIDSKGNIYTGEVAPGVRAQKFTFKGLSDKLPPNAINTTAVAPAAAQAAPAPAGVPALAQAPAQGGAPGGRAGQPGTAGGRAGQPGTAPAPGGRGGPAGPPPRTTSTMANGGYKMLMKWPNLGTIKPGGAIGIFPDDKGGVWLQHRSDPAILHLNAAGEVTQTFNVTFSSSHGLCRDRDGNFWALDSGPFNDAPDAGVRGNQVFKYSPEGKLLLTLGKPGVGRAGTDTFLQPTACRETPDGLILIADGHWPRPANSQQDGDRLVWITREGKFVKEFGRMGTGPGEFIGPHGLAFDSQGRLFVADRSNNRIQIFDKDMNFLDDWRHFGRPSGIAILKDDTMVVADSESGYGIGGPPIAPEGGGNAIRNPGWQNGIRIGNARDGSLRAFIPGNRPEGMAADELGNIYGGLTGGCNTSPSGGCLQKFVK
jgi:DNA-binding beta-propeller fold protein YncE